MCVRISVPFFFMYVYSDSAILEIYFIHFVIKWTVLILKRMRIVFYKVFFILLLIIIQATLITFGQDTSQQTRSNRKKRFLIFPKGTVIQLVYCYLMSALGTEGIFTVGATLGTNWDVPSDLDKLLYNEETKIQANRRDKRSLYPRIEYMLNQLNIDGRICLENLLCRYKKQAIFESNSQSKNSFTEEIIVSIFTYPSLPRTLFQPIDEYDHILSKCTTIKPENACIVK